MDVADRTERELTGDMYKIVKEGMKCRDTPDAVNPHRANSIEQFLHMQGWLIRDLQIALCRADPKYRATQKNSVSDELLNQEQTR